MKKFILIYLGIGVAVLAFTKLTDKTGRDELGPGFWLVAILL